MKTNDEELPPIGANDDDSPWSLEHGREEADHESGTVPSCDHPAGDGGGMSPSGGDPPEDEGVAPDPPRSDRATARPDDPVVRRRDRRERKPPFARPWVRQGTKGSMWRETLQVEMPPTLNFLSLGIGFALGCGFCFFLMAVGLLPGSRIVPDPMAAPVHDSKPQLDPLDVDPEAPAEAPKIEVGQSDRDDAARDEPSETDPASNADESLAEPAQADE